MRALKNIFLLLSLSIFISGYSNDTDAKFQRGIDLVKRLKRVEAKQIFTEIIESTPDYGEAFFERGKINKYFKEYELAKKDFIQATRSRNISAENKRTAHFELSDLKIMEKDYTGAILDLSIVINENSNDAEAYYQRGSCYQETGNYKGSLKDINKAIELAPEKKEYHLLRGLAKLELELFEDAIHDFDTVLTVDKEHAEAYFYKAYCEFKEGVSDNFKHHKQHLHNAYDDYSHALKLDPELEVAYFNRGEIQMELGHYIEAIADFKKAIAINPNDLEAHFLKAMCNYHYGYRVVALKEFQEIVARDSLYSDAIYQIGYINYESENYEEALASFNKLISIESAHKDAFIFRGYTYFELGNQEAACNDFKIAEKLGDKEGHHDVVKYCK